MSLKQVIIVRKDLGMSAGKIVAQAAHASLEAAEKTRASNPAWLEEWKGEGQTKVVLRVHGKRELLQLFMKMKALPAVLIKDAGRTQISAGEPTCIAIGPAPEKEIDKYTKELKLL